MLTTRNADERNQTRSKYSKRSPMFLDRQPHPSKEVNSPQTDTITIKIPERFLVNTD